MAVAVAGGMKNKWKQIKAGNVKVLHGLLKET